MALRTFILMVFLFQAIMPVFSQNVRDSELRRIVNVDGQAQVSVPLKDINPGEITRNVSIVTIRNDSVMIRLSPVTVEWFISGNYNYTINYLKKPDPDFSAKGLREWDTYPSFSQYDSIMRSFIERYPLICSLDTIGISIYGKPVLVLKISDNVSEDEDEPEVFYTSSMHGDETVGFILLLRLCSYILENYESERISNLAEDLEIWINPLANPDGMYGRGNYITSPVRFNANGIDLNRNFPDPALTNQVIEKENADMIRFLRERRFVLSANFHSGAEVVNYPWDRFRNKLHADNQWFFQISRTYADTVHINSIPFYMSDFHNGVVRGATWYQINGGRQDFVTADLQGREVTIELDETFVTPPSRLPVLWEYNYRSLIGYLEHALFGIHGIVLDAKTSDPVAARIFVEDHDYDSSHVFTDTLYGSFTRMLPPGIRNIRISANGYRDTILANISVSYRQRTDLTVFMEQGYIENESSVPLLWPNPASSIVKGILNAGMAGIITVEIISTTGKIIRTSEATYSLNVPFETDVSRLPGGLYFIRFTNHEKGITSTGKFHVIR